MSTPKAIRGTQDIFGAEAEAFAHVVETFERVRKLYRFRRIEMPVFEKTEVFSRSIGETTDVVSKEMYTFDDRGGESLTLRPEFTAGIARAYLTNGWQQHAPLKVATHGHCSATNARKRAATASSTSLMPRSSARRNRRPMSSCWCWPISCSRNWGSLMA